MSNAMLPEYREGIWEIRDNCLIALYPQGPWLIRPAEIEYFQIIHGRDGGASCETWVKVRAQAQVAPIGRHAAAQYGMPAFLQQYAGRNGIPLYNQDAAGNPILPAYPQTVGVAGSRQPAIHQTARKTGSGSRVKIGLGLLLGAIVVYAMTGQTATLILAAVGVFMLMSKGGGRRTVNGYDDGFSTVDSGSFQDRDGDGRDDRFENDGSSSDDGAYGDDGGLSDDGGSSDDGGGGGDD